MVRIVLIAMLMVLSTGCIFGGKKNSTSPPTEITRPGVHPKLILKISGPANWEDGAAKVRAALVKLPYVDDASVSNRYYGAIFIHLVPGAAWDIKEIQKAVKAAGYDIVRAAEITW